MTPQQRRAKEALLRVLTMEETEYVGRFLSDEEALRVLSIQDEIDRVEAQLAGEGR